MEGEGGSGKDGTYLIVFKFGRQEGWRVQGLFSEALLLYIYFFNSHPFSKNKEKKTLEFHGFDGFELLIINCTNVWYSFSENFDTK